MNDNININQNINQINVSEQKNNVIVSSVGTQGIPGVGATNLFYTFEQQTSSSSWTITHNLGYYPSVVIQDYGKISIEGSVNYVNPNSLIITFSVPVSGYAYLS